MKRHVRNAIGMILQDLEYVDAPQTVLTTKPFIWAVLVATASQFSVGYNTGVMNAPEKVVFVGHSTTLWSWAVAAFAVGGPLGAVLGGRLADSQGRRGAFLIDVAAFLLGGILQTLAPNMTVIVLSRFIIGFASGFSSVLVPIYLGEVRVRTNQMDNYSCTTKHTVGCEIIIFLSSHFFCHVISLHPRDCEARWVL